MILYESTSADNTCYNFLRYVRKGCICKLIFKFHFVLIWYLTWTKLSLRLNQLIFRSLQRFYWFAWFMLSVDAFECVRYAVKHCEHNMRAFSWWIMYDVLHAVCGVKSDTLHEVWVLFGLIQCHSWRWERCDAFVSHLESDKVMGKMVIHATVNGEISTALIGVGTAGATGALAPAVLKPRVQKYIFAPAIICQVYLLVIAKVESSRNLFKILNLNFIMYYEYIF